jgi:hypothetical protein
MTTTDPEQIVYEQATSVGAPLLMQRSVKPAVINTARIATEVAPTEKIPRLDLLLFKGRFNKHAGQSLIEFVVGIFVLMLLILGAFQFALVYRAKATLDYATFQAAREGAVNHASIHAIRGGLAAGLTPLYTVKPDAGDLSKAYGRAMAAVRLTHIQIINPTKAAFNDFAVQDTYNGKKEIPNDNLAYRSTNLGERSGMNVQDANVLKIKVTYGYKLIVPLIKPIILGAFKVFGKGPPIGKDGFQTAMLNTGHLPLESQAIVRMQSPAFENSAMIEGGKDKH